MDHGGVTCARPDGSGDEESTGEPRAAGSGRPFLLILAAEGTRTRGEYWTSGFWRIARSAKLPIALAFIDGPTRTTGFGPTITASDDVVADMDKVRAFYRDKRGIHPERRTEPRLREELRAPTGGETPLD